MICTGELCAELESFLLDFTALFIFVIAALNDYVIVASIIVIAIRNLINCAALIQTTAVMTESTSFTLMVVNWKCINFHLHQDL